jgi:hypothetical protein
LQAVLSLLPTADGTTDSRLALAHAALQHFATAAKLAAFVKRGDLAESAARLAYNAVTDLTRAAALPALRTTATALNATKPPDVDFQVRGESGAVNKSCTRRLP